MILVVKGQAQAAMMAAKERGFTDVEYVKPSEHRSSDKDTLLRVPYTARERVWSWFNEDLYWVTPYQEGALLHYSYEPEDRQHISAALRSHRTGVTPKFL